MAFDGGIVGIQHARDRLGRHAVDQRADEVAGAELAEVEVVGRGRAPEPQAVDRLAAVADDRPVVGHAEQAGRAVAHHAQAAGLQRERARDRHVHGLARAHDLPGIGPQQPGIGPLDLPAVVDLLAKDAVLVAQAVAGRRDLHGRERIDEAGGQAPEPAIAEPGIRLGLEHLGPVLARVRAEVLAHQRLEPEVDDVVGERAAEQELHREVVDPLGVRLVLRLLGQQPALAQDVAQRARHGLEALALIGILEAHHVVEDQVAVVVVLAAQPHRADLVLLQDVVVGHGLTTQCAAALIDAAMEMPTRCRDARRRLHDLGREIGRRDDLQHLEVVRAGDLAVLDRGRLQDRIALADRALPLPLVLEGRPAVQHQHELEVALVDVPVLHLVLLLLAVVPDDVGDVIPLGPVLDAEVAVIENLAQAGRPLGIARLVVHEVPRLLPACRHDRLHCLRPVVTDRSLQPSVHTTVTPLSTESTWPVVIADSSEAR